MGVDAILRASRNAERVRYPVEAVDDRRRSHRAEGHKFETENSCDQQQHPSNDCKQASCYVDPDWTEEQRQEFEERAAIIEFDGQLPCNLAEFIAARIINARGR